MSLARSTLLGLPVIIERAAQGEEFYWASSAVIIHRELTRNLIIFISKSNGEIKILQVIWLMSKLKVNLGHEFGLGK